MNEHDPQQAPEARPASDPKSPDWRRLEVARDRFLDRIAGGIEQALVNKTEVDDGTARCIAHVLGRAFGRSSALADFARTGEGQYLTLRDEYLSVYGDVQADHITKEWIDWLGTYLVQRENTGSGRHYMNEHLPPKLEQLLVRTELYVQGRSYTVHLPASLDSREVDALREELIQLSIDQDEALQAFLSLPDVSAGSDNLMESFHQSFAGTYPDEETALRALSPLEDWEDSLADWCIDNGVEPESLKWDLGPLIARLHDVYELVPWKGQLHAFGK